MRAFIGIRIPEFSGYDRLRERLAMEFGGNARIVEPGNLHITLRFLGEVSEDECGEVWNRIAFPRDSFSITGNGIGHFPEGKTSARVIFVPVLSDDLERIAMSNPELRDQEKDFHCTVARLKKPQHVNGIEDEFRAVAFFSFPVKRISLFRSQLLRTGPVYEELLFHQLM